VSVTFYASPKLARLKTADQVIARETMNAIKRGQNTLRRTIAKEFASRGIGRAMFGKGYSKAGLKTVIKRERPRKIGETYTANVRVKGIAAIVATGDRTKRHSIGSVGKFIGNKARGFAARGVVRHPGSKFEPDNFIDRAVSKTAGVFPAEMEKARARVAAVING
jgi:hypothetical protein